MRLDTHKLAWAAGFFDGEGCTYAKKWDAFKNGYSGMALEITQADSFVLYKFRDAVGGLGKVYFPNARGVWKFRSTRFEHIQAIVAMLWKWLSPPKREQWRAAIKIWTAAHSTPLVQIGTR